LAATRSLFTDPHRIVRFASLTAVAIGLVALAMLKNNWNAGRYLLVALIACISVLLLYNVWRAFSHFLEHSGRLRSSAYEAERHYIDVLGRIVKIVEARGMHWSGHSARVGKLAEQIARRRGMDQNAATMMNLAGQLHDIGLLAVPDAVLHQHTNFGSEAFGSVQRHSEASFEVLRPLESLASVLPAIRHHHERMNGTGYPMGLTGENIPLGARILAVADAYDAMTHDRPHRSALTPYRAMQELRRCTPAGFDETCVDALAEVVNLPRLKELLAGAASD
jgi:HD-GYP domain-containing protein (c-di-GMP phosphodiesterase class II)